PRHRFSRLELVAPYEIHPGKNSLELLAQPAFDLLLHTADAAERAARDFCQVVEDPILHCHGSLLSRDISRTALIGKRAATQIVRASTAQTIATRLAASLARGRPSACPAKRRRL